MKNTKLIKIFHLQLLLLIKKYHKSVKTLTYNSIEVETQITKIFLIYIIFIFSTIIFKKRSIRAELPRSFESLNVPKRYISHVSLPSIIPFPFRSVSQLYRKTTQYLYFILVPELLILLRCSLWPKRKQ